MGSTINRTAGNSAVLVSSLAMMLSASTNAQETGNHAKCAQLDDPQARLECYDAVSGRQPPARAASESAEPSPEPAQPSPSPEPAQPSPIPEPAQPSPIPEPAQPSPSSEPAQPSPSSEPAASQGQEEYAPLSDTVGEEQLKSAERNDADAVPVQGTVTRCQEGATGKWYFYFDNGQVWQQKDNDRLSLRDCNFEVKISKDFFGYKMEIPGTGNKIRIGRVK